MSRRFLLLFASVLVLLATVACQVAGVPASPATPTVAPPVATVPPPPTTAPQNDAAVPTNDALTLTVREDDIEALVTQPTAAQQFTVENLEATFDDGSIQLMADRLTYGLLTVNNLTIEGTVTAVDGRPRLDVTRIQPNNLVTAAIPGILTRLLESLTTGYYVEEIQIDDGLMTIRVRP
jgi:hypothetical protein